MGYFIWLRPSYVVCIHEILIIRRKLLIIENIFIQYHSTFLDNIILVICMSNCTSLSEVILSENLDRSVDTVL